MATHSKGHGASTQQAPRQLTCDTTHKRTYEQTRVLNRHHLPEPSVVLIHQGGREGQGIDNLFPLLRNQRRQDFTALIVFSRYLPLNRRNRRRAHGRVQDNNPCWDVHEFSRINPTASERLTRLTPGFLAVPASVQQAILFLRGEVRVVGGLWGWSVSVCAVACVQAPSRLCGSGIFPPGDRRPETGDRRLDRETKEDTRCALPVPPSAFRCCPPGPLSSLLQVRFAPQVINFDDRWVCKNNPL